MTTNPTKIKWATVNTAVLSFEELQEVRREIIKEKQQIEFSMETRPLHRVQKVEILAIEARRATAKERIYHLQADLSVVNADLKRRNVAQSSERQIVQGRVLDIAYAIFVLKQEAAVPLMRSALSNLLGTGWTSRPVDPPEPGNQR